MRFTTSLFVGIIMLATFQAFAQENDSTKLKTKLNTYTKNYFEIGIGGNFGTGIGTFSTYIENKDGSQSVENNYNSYGQGVDLSFALGSKLNKNIGIELNIGGMLGTKFHQHNEYYNTNDPIAYTVQQDINHKASTFKINPRIVLEVPIKKENYLYTKIGYLVGFGNATASIDETYAFENGTSSNGHYERVSTGGMVTGSTSSIGFKLATKEENVSFFIEFTANTLHRKFEKSTLTESMLNGVSNLGYINEYYKQTIFQDKVTNYTTIDYTQPRKYPSYRSNYNTAGFRLGFVVGF